MTFSNSGGLADAVNGISQILDDHSRILGDHSKELQLLRPYQDLTMFIRELILDEFSGAPTMSNTRWQRNSPAYGGQVVTDRQIIQQEHNIEQKEIWCQGFRRLYGIEYEYGHDIIYDPTITNILNIHADALSLDISRDDGLVEKSARLIEVWRAWADRRMEWYPFQDPVYECMLHDLLESV